MSNAKNWRKKAGEKLAAPVIRKRNLSTVIGKVEDCFEAIRSARQRGMPWKDIAAALEDDIPISVDAVESAYTRICRERGLAASVRPSRSNRSNTLPSARKTGISEQTRQTPAAKAAQEAQAHLGATHQSPPPESLFGEGRWIDNG
jgi:hypothetical protein